MRGTPRADTRLLCTRSRDPLALLRAQVEILLQTTKSADKQLVETVFKILYATEDDFEAPPEGQAAATGAGAEARSPAEEPEPAAAPAPGHAPKDSFGSADPAGESDLGDADEL